MTGERNLTPLEATDAAAIGTSRSRVGAEPDIYRMLNPISARSDFFTEFFAYRNVCHSTPPKILIM